MTDSAPVPRRAASASAPNTGKRWHPTRPIPIGFHSPEEEHRFVGGRRHLNTVRGEKANARAEALGRLPLAGVMTVRAIARHFGVSVATAYDCKRRWRCMVQGVPYQTRDRRRR